MLRIPALCVICSPVLEFEIYIFVNILDFLKVKNTIFIVLKNNNHILIIIKINN